jgi:D-sedoheptulose 7-phosphate isomerase
MNEPEVLAILRDHQQVVARLEVLAPQIRSFAALIRAAVAGGGTVYWFGNGGSAADAQHLSAELMGRYVKERRGLRSFALTTDSSLMTAVANDYHFDRVYARQVETLARPGDVVVAISTSGNSANVLAGAIAARAAGATVVGLTGESGGRLRGACDLCLCAPSAVTARVQECHGLIGHAVCELLDAWTPEEGP